MTKFVLVLALTLVVVQLAAAWQYSKEKGFSASACESLPSSDKCSTDGDCTWCESAAVGDACYTAADAAGLPAAVFTCNSGAASLSSNSTSIEFGKKKSSDADTMYVLAYSWSPGFCNTQSGDPGCSDPESYWTNHFTLHGLWPQYTTSGYPHDCTTEKFDPKAPESVGMDTMNKYWPNVQESEGSSDYDSFWEHEWSKHGTCSGLSQDDYFSTAIDTISSFGTPSVVTSNVGKSISGDDVRDAFGGSSKVSLICSNGQLTGAYTCWSKGSDDKPTGQVVCPGDVQTEDTCGSGNIEIPSF